MFYMLLVVFFIWAYSKSDLDCVLTISIFYDIFLVYKWFGKIYDFLGLS